MRESPFYSIGDECSSSWEHGGIFTINIGVQRWMEDTFWKGMAVLDALKLEFTEVLSLN